MLKFTYKQTIRERVQANCPRHPRYNPEKTAAAKSKAAAPPATSSTTCSPHESGSTPPFASSPGAQGLGLVTGNATAQSLRSQKTRRASRNRRTRLCSRPDLILRVLELLIAEPFAKAGALHTSDAARPGRL